MRSSARIAAVVLVATAAFACSSGDKGTPTLNWYINADNGGQADLAKACTEKAGGRYRIKVSQLPADANGQRDQLVRRLAAKDSSIDLMSLDVVFVPEFANADFLHYFDSGEAEKLTDGVLAAPAESAEWDGKLAAAPFTATTQLLWYRKSVAAKAGLDLTSGTATWDQVIGAAEQTDTTVAVTGNRYEGYMVWINSLVEGAGGTVLKDPEAGVDVEPDLNSKPGRTAAEIVHKLGTSRAADSQLSSATEEEARSTFLAPRGGFMANWTYVYQANRTAVEDGSLPQQAFDDIAWARFPESIAGEPSKPPLGGIHLGIGAYTKHPDFAVDAVECLTSTESEVQYMLAEGNPASREAVYDDPQIQEEFPMWELIRDSIADAGVRPLTPYYSDVSGAVQRQFHPPAGVDPSSTPAEADSLIVRVLHDKQLL